MVQELRRWWLALEKERLVDWIPLQGYAQGFSIGGNEILPLGGEGEYRNPGFELLQLARHTLRQGECCRFAGLGCRGGRPCCSKVLPIHL